MAFFGVACAERGVILSSTGPALLHFRTAWFSINPDSMHIPAKGIIKFSITAPI
jgi:hypothetical protein